MVSKLRTQKYLHIFYTFLDLNNKGYIDEKDIDVLIINVRRFRGWKEDDAKHVEAPEAWYKIWQGWLRDGDTNKDGKLSADEWVAMWDAFARNPKKKPDWYQLYEDYIYMYYGDSEMRDEITLKMQKYVLLSFGRSAEEVTAAFQKASQGKPSINRTEFQKLWMEYLTSDDPNAPGNYLLGKLPRTPLVYSNVNNKNKMISEFRKKKLLFSFDTYFDYDRNGFLDRNDIKVAMLKIAELKNLETQDENYGVMNSHVTKIWEDMMEQADISDGGVISPQQWLQMWAEYDPTKPREWIQNYRDAVYKIFDLNNDGFIKLEEFVTVCVFYGLDKDDVTEAFRKASQGKDTISEAEYKDMWKTYFSSDDPEAPGNFILGKSSF